MYVVGARCFVLILYVTSTSVVMMHQVKKKLSCQKSPGTGKNGPSKGTHDAHKTILCLCQKTKNTMPFTKQEHTRLRCQLYKATLRSAEFMLRKHNLIPLGKDRIRDICTRAEAEFGITFSERINGHVTNHRILMERMFHRQINLDQNLAVSETKFPNVHASARERWSTQMLSSAIRISLPKAHAQINKLLDGM